MNLVLEPKIKDYLAESAWVDTFNIIKERINEDELTQILDAIKEQLASLEVVAPTVCNVWLN